MNYELNSPNIIEWLDEQTNETLDMLEFGVVKMNIDGIVLHYNTAETQIAGVKKEKAIGKHFFTQIAPCTNNFMVAEKYKQEVLDEEVPYIFTFVTQPIMVVLRLLKGTKGYQYLLVKKTY